VFLCRASSISCSSRMLRKPAIHSLCWRIWWRDDYCTHWHYCITLSIYVIRTWRATSLWLRNHI